MHSILFSLIRPDDNPQLQSAWHDTVRELQYSVKLSAEIEVLGIGTWLLTGSGGWLLLSNAIRLADRNGVAFRVLLIEQATEWSSAKTSEKTP